MGRAVLRRKFSDPIWPAKGKTRVLSGFCTPSFESPCFLSFVSASVQPWPSFRSSGESSLLPCSFFQLIKSKPLDLLFFSFFFLPDTVFVLVFVIYCCVWLLKKSGKWRRRKILKVWTFGFSGESESGKWRLFTSPTLVRLLGN